MATTNSWSDASISKLKALFKKGISTAEIGKRLGFTKNAVVGKINRLKLNKGEERKSVPKKAPKIRPKPEPKPKKPVDKKKSGSDAKQKTERIIQQSAALMSLRADQCRWPMGDPDSDDFKFCGEKCFAGKPYCFEHCKVAYQFTQPVKKK
jgi:GcrA cell cycle regulator